MTLLFETWKITCVTNYAEEIINCIRLAFEAAFPGMPLQKRFKLRVEPESRFLFPPLLYYLLNEYQLLFVIIFQIEEMKITKGKTNKE